MVVVTARNTDYLGALVPGRRQFRTERAFFHMAAIQTLRVVRLPCPRLYAALVKSGGAGKAHARCASGRNIEGDCGAQRPMQLMRTSRTPKC